MDQTCWLHCCQWEGDGGQDRSRHCQPRPPPVLPRVTLSQVGLPRAATWRETRARPADRRHQVTSDSNTADTDQGSSSGRDISRFSPEDPVDLFLLFKHWSSLNTTSEEVRGRICSLYLGTLGRLNLLSWRTVAERGRLQGDCLQLGATGRSLRDGLHTEHQTGPRGHFNSRESFLRQHEL